jgi:endosialidase-like protein
LVSLFALFGFSVLAFAGSLTPPGSPASTMNTLEELFDSIAGTFDSSALISDQNGSLIQHLKYIEENLSVGVSSDSLDFDEFVDSMTLDGDTSIASAGFDFSIMGNVGIGTTAPEMKLEVIGSLSVAGNILFKSPGAATAVTREITFTETGVDANGSRIFIHAGDAGGPFLTDGGWVKILAGSGGTDPSGGGGDAYLGGGDGPFGGGNAFIFGGGSTGFLGAGDVVLGVTDYTGGSNTGVVRGFVGVGKAFPSTKLDVAGTASASYGLFGVLQVAGLSSTSYSRFGTDTTFNSSWISSTDDLLLSADFETHGSAQFSSFLRVSSGSTTALFADSSTGNVGIGDSTPTTTLDVAGNASISGTLEVGSMIANGSILPGVNDAYDLGSSTLRWRDLYVASGSLHIGTSGDEAIIDYHVNDDYLSLKPNGSVKQFQLFDTGAASLSNALYVTSAANVGIGTTSPGAKLHAFGIVRSMDATTYGIDLDPAGSGVGGPTVSIGIAGSPAGYMQIGAYSARNNIDTKDRDLRIFSTGDTTGITFQQSDGNVGIGTATPGAKLAVSGTASVSGNFGVRSGGTVALYANPTSGNVGIGTTVPAAKLDVTTTGNIGIQTESTKSNGNAHGIVAYARTSNSGNNIGVYGYGSNEGAGLAYSFFGESGMLYNLENTGIGALIPVLKLHVASSSDDNILRLENSDATCDINPDTTGLNTSCSSDRRLKANIHDSSPLLAQLMKLRIRDYTVISSGKEYTGVIAQEVQEVWPELVSSNSATGYLMVSAPSTWQIIKAIQELDARISNNELRITGPMEFDEQSPFDQLIEYLKDAVLAVRILVAGEVQTDRICVGNTCVTEEQFKDVFGDGDHHQDEVGDDESSGESGDVDAGTTDADTDSNIIDAPHTDTTDTDDIVDDMSDPGDDSEGELTQEEAVGDTSEENQETATQ